MSIGERSEGGWSSFGRDGQFSDRSFLNLGNGEVTPTNQVCFSMIAINSGFCERRFYGRWIIISVRRKRSRLRMATNRT